MKFWIIIVTFALDTANNYFYEDFYKTRLMMMCHQSKSDWKMDQQLRWYSRNNHILIILVIALTLTLMAAKQSFHKTVWPMVIHHHTKFGNKTLNSLEDTPRQTFSEILMRPDKHSMKFWTFAVTLTLNRAIKKITRQSSPKRCTIKTKFSSKRIRLYFNFEPCALDPEDSNQILSAWHSVQHMMMYHVPLMYPCTNGIGALLSDSAFTRGTVIQSYSFK